MTPLLKVTKALKAAHDSLPDKKQIVDLAYLLDVDPIENESLVVFATMREDALVGPKRKLEIESIVRHHLAKACSYQTYFRWRTSSEPAWDAPTLTKGGLLDRPVSALGTGRKRRSA